MSIPNTDYKPILSVINGLIPQCTMTELSTALQLIYTTTAIGGSGSRRKVMDILIGLGIQPNK